MIFPVAVASVSAAIMATQILAARPATDDQAIARAVRALRTVRAGTPIPSIVVIDGRSDPEIRTAMITFRLRDRRTGELDPRIYVNSESVMYRLAGQGHTVGVVMLAASLAHEIGHGEGQGEAGAYATEAEFLRVYLASQPINDSDRENLEYNLVNVENLQRIATENQRRLSRISKRDQ